ncbi:MAG: glycine cleavage system aminomethyltransferase GcvT, partial [Chitinivibrionales bacterium]|nr:glycine cleavage system aminomethyltransferase GcvT [Chitinivibrionales bacterium]MBD3357399.1 glycine cleavage system aminomethyltransferase GcvT [Chitinivibrionales bacterium]
MDNHEAQCRTVLYDLHIALDAKMTSFGGFLMPLHYQGILKEHRAVRDAAGVFDTCHMGEFRIGGPKAVADLENLLSSSVATMAIGQCRYGFICNEQGGTIDDQVLYRLAEEEFMMVVNASTRKRDFDWLKAHVSEGTTTEDISERTAKIDLQGPSSPVIMAKLTDESIEDMKFYRWRRSHFRDRPILMSRTGYTGEVGFEIYCDNDLAPAIWNECIKGGATPAGLGARDTLRLEMGMPLYGHELNANRNPAETGFGRAISTDKRFIGSEKILAPTHRPELLVGIALNGKRSARSGDVVNDKTGIKIGTVTSGSFSPSLERGIALAYVDKGRAAIGTLVNIDNGRRELPGSVVELPFYKFATGRKPMKELLNKNGI